MKKSLDDHRLSWASEQGIKPDRIHRKPLSSSLFTRPSSIGSLETLQNSGPDSQPSISEANDDTRPQRHIENIRPGQLNPHDGNNTIARKPVGPRPLNARLTTADSGMTGRKPVGGSELEGNTRPRALTGPSPQPQRLESSGAERNSVDNTTLRSSRSGTVANNASGPSSPPPSLPPRPSHSSVKLDREKDFRITIIRRDPTSGTQWNIGSLVREQQSASTEGDTLKIEITTPGYQRFTRQPDLQAQSRQSIEQTIADIKRFSMSDNPPTLAERKTPGPASSHFERLPFTRELSLANRPKSSHRRHRSSSSDLSPTDLSIPTSPRRSHSNLTFLSPWHGTCTFTTGMDGRSLKCRHRLPSSTTTSSNSEHQNGSSSDTSIIAAELRFNLPWSALRNRDVNAPFSPGSHERGSSFPLASLGKDAKSTLRRGVARIKREINTDSHIRRPSQTSISHSSSDDDESDDTASSGRLDLTLGRERAGGGRKGESAKLGKLVLRDEGLKMADLVVAAAMGVWWDVYWGR